MDRRGEQYGWARPIGWIVTGPARLTRAEVEIFRRSVGAVGQLPPDQLRRLLDEAALLMEERERIQRVLAALGPPWTDVRSSLNELDALLRARRLPRGEVGDHPQG